MIKHIKIFKFFVLTIAIAVISLLANTAYVRAEMIERIAAVVNEDVITYSEINDRLNLILASTSIGDRAELKERFRGQVVSQLVDEQLRLQEIAKENIEVTEDEIKDGILSLAERNKTSYQGIMSLLEQQRINPQTLRRQIRSEIGWSKYVRDVIGTQVRISDADVNSELDRLRESIGKEQYLVAEIFLPVEGKDDVNDKRILAQKLFSQMIENGAPFQQIAAQFSQSASAAKGGDLGWIIEGQLNETLNDVLTQLQVGQLSTPVMDDDGYHILFLREKRELTEDTMPSVFAIRTRLGNERLNKLAQKFLFDLKSSAFIDLRV